MKKSPGGNPPGLLRWTDATISQLSVRQYCQKQQGHDIGDLDHRVDRRSRCILVRIADRIPCDCCLVSIRSLPAKMTILDVLLGVIPGSTAGGHGDRDEKSGYDDTQKHGAYGREGCRL